MAKIIIAGSSIVLKSEAKLEAIQKLTQYKPLLLEKRGEKDELIFKVAVAAKGDGSISDKAVYFAPVTHDAEGKATVTLPIPEDVKDAKEYAADLLANTFTQLSELEGIITCGARTVDNERAAMIERIEQQ